MLEVHWLLVQLRDKIINFIIFIVLRQPKLQFIQQTLAKAIDDIQRRDLCVCLNQNSRLKK